MIDLWKAKYTSRKSEANSPLPAVSPASFIVIEENVMNTELSVKKSYADVPTADLVIMAQRKDEAALTELLKRHKAFISNRLYKLAPDWKDQSDLVQEVNIRVWRFIGQLKKANSFRTWLSQLVLNVFYDELRKRPRDFHLVSLDEPMSDDSTDTREIKDACQLPDDELLGKELMTVLTEAMKDIPEQFKEAQLLRDIKGLSYEEIAKITGTELGTVKSRIARARLRIQQRVAPYLECA